MYGAKGARILTEINRLPQLNPPLNGEIAAPFSPLVTAMRAETRAARHAALPYLFI